MTWHASDILDTLLQPLGRTHFFAEYWDRRACHLPGARDRFAGLFDRGQFDAALEQCREVKAAFLDDRRWFSEMRIEAGQAAPLFAAGMTICAGVLPETGAAAEFLRAYRAAVRSAGAVHFNSYLSPEGSGFGLHFDNHPVWIMQIEGAKLWRFVPTPAVPHPPVNITMPPDRERLTLPWGTIDRPAEDAFAEAILEPGDALYLPAGCWHVARARGTSLALTLATTPAGAIDLLRPLLARRAADFPALFRALPAVPAARLSEATTPPELSEALAAIRTALVGFATGLSDTDLLAAWQAATSAPPRNKV